MATRLALQVTIGREIARPCMNAFKSTNAPFAVVIIASALGWYISTLQSTLGDHLSLVYAFSSEGNGTIVLRVDNISREKTFSGEFNILCIKDKGEGACLKEGKKSIAQYRIVDPYNLSNEVSPTVSPDGDTVKVEAWIPPSASLEIELASNYPASSYRFQFYPEKPENNETMPEFYVSGLQSFLIQNFDALLIYAFDASPFCLVAFLVAQLFCSTKRTGNQND